MKRAAWWIVSIGFLVALVSVVPSAGAAGNPMKLVGALNPWKDGQFSNVAADASRHVAYLGSFDDQGVAVISTVDPTDPVLTDRLSTHITSDALTSDSADLDLVGRPVPADAGASGRAARRDPHGPAGSRGRAGTPIRLRQRLRVRHHRGLCGQRPDRRGRRDLPVA